MLRSTLISEFLGKILTTGFEKTGVQIFEGVALFRVRPLGGGLPSPTWPLEILGPGTPTKMVFVRGRSPPIWGRYGVWLVCILVHFFSKLWPQILEFLTWSIVPRAYYRFWDFKENLIHVTQINFVQSSEKTRKVPRPLQWANVKILSRWSRNGAR